MSFWKEPTPHQLAEQRVDEWLKLPWNSKIIRDEARRFGHDVRKHAIYRLRAIIACEIIRVAIGQPVAQLRLTSPNCA